MTHKKLADPAGTPVSLRGFGPCDTTLEILSAGIPAHDWPTAMQTRNGEHQGSSWQMSRPGQAGGEPGCPLDQCGTDSQKL